MAFSPVKVMVSARHPFYAQRRVDETDSRLGQTLCSLLAGRYSSQKVPS